MITIWRFACNVYENECSIAFMREPRFLQSRTGRTVTSWNVEVTWKSRRNLSGEQRLIPVVSYALVLVINNMLCFNKVWSIYFTWTNIIFTLQKSTYVVIFNLARIEMRCLKWSYKPCWRISSRLLKVYYSEDNVALAVGRAHSMQRSCIESI